MTRPDDSPAIVGIFGLPHVVGFVHAPTEEQVRSAIEESGLESWVVERDGEIVGHLMLGKMGGWLREVRTLVVRERRVGIGAFAMRRALKRAFDEDGAHRMYLEVVERNVGARALYERLGFTSEGCFHDGYRNEDGSYENLIPYGLLAREYRRAAV